MFSAFTLSPSKINENRPANTVVGRFTVQLENGTSSSSSGGFAFKLVNGSGGEAITCLKLQTLH